MKISCRYHRVLINDVKRTTKIDGMAPFKHFICNKCSRSYIFKGPYQFVEKYHFYVLGFSTVNYNNRVLISVCPSVRLYVRLAAGLGVCLSVCLPVCVKWCSLHDIALKNN